MGQRLEFESPSWEQFYLLCLELADRIRKDKYSPDLMIGIIRGGLVPLRVLSDEFEGVEVATMRVIFYEDVNKTMSEPKITQIPTASIKGNVLLVDDVADTGGSLLIAKKYVMENGAKDVRTATVYYKPWSKIKPDYFVRTTERWVIFPHERREATITLSKRMFAEGLGKYEVRQRLIDIGIEPTLVDRYLVEVQQQ